MRLRRRSPAPPAAGGLKIERYADGARHRLALAGDLDISTVDALLDCVRDLGARGARSIVLDLRDLAFMDSTGLSALLGCRRICRERRCAFALIPGPPHIQRVFQMTGLDGQFAFERAAS